VTAAWEERRTHHGRDFELSPARRKRDAAKEERRRAAMAEQRNARAAKSRDWPPAERRSEQGAPAEDRARRGLMTDGGHERDARSEHRSACQEEPSGRWARPPAGKAAAQRRKTSARPARRTGDLGTATEGDGEEETSSAGWVWGSAGEPPWEEAKGRAGARACRGVQSRRPLGGRPR
jgi:hypothetical protein